jgi:transposase-like protein
MKADESLPKETTLRSSKYLNNLIEQDHRNIKSRINAMLGFKRFGNAATTIAGIELMHRIRKGQFDFANMRLKDTPRRLSGTQSFALDEVAATAPLFARR